MAANIEKETAGISYDPLELGYSVVNEAPEVNKQHKPGDVYFSKDVMQEEIEQIFMKNGTFTFSCVPR